MRMSECLLQVLEEAVTNMPDPMRFMITVPKFSMRLKTSMKDILQAMGLTRLFSGDAELQRMVRDSPGRLAVSDVMHEAVIEVGFTSGCILLLRFVVIVDSRSCVCVCVLSLIHISEPTRPP